MGVLDAWANAEKISYPVVGEGTKEASNVIDYNINEEITTNKSSIFNANNDTTTGMATIIPGVNAPKLIQSTSIYQNTDSLSGGATITASKDLYRPGDTTGNIREWTISDIYGNITYENKISADTLWNGLYIPVGGWYEIFVTYPYGGSSYCFDTTFKLAKGGHGNDIVVHAHEGIYSSNLFTETFRYNFNAGDRLYVGLELHYRGSSTGFSGQATVKYTITKL